jgi:hypothetical protein
MDAVILYYALLFLPSFAGMRAEHRLISDQALCPRSKAAINVDSFNWKITLDEIGN